MFAKLGFFVGLGLAATTLMACTSSPAPTVGPPSSHGSPGAGRPSTVVSGAPRTVPAPATLQALPLLKGAGLPAALGTSLRGFQDDGGATITYPTTGFISVAETQSRLTRFQVSLQSYANPADATQAYNQLTLSGGKPLPGVGDKAMDMVAQQVVVLKASQVLVVGVDLTAAGNDYLAEHGKSVSSVLTALDRPGQAAARAIAARLTGAPVTGSRYLQLPAGAIDPCALSTTALGAATKQPVTTRNGPSETRPAQQCNVTIGSSSYLVQTYTATQAAAAIPATTLAAVYLQDAKVHAPGPRVHAASAHLAAYMDIDTDFTLEVLVSRGQGSSWRASSTAPETARQALVRIRNSRTAPVSRQECYALGKEAALQLVLGMPQSEVDQFFHELVDWCSRFPSHS